MFYLSYTVLSNIVNIYNTKQFCVHHNNLVNVFLIDDFKKKRKPSSMTEEEEMSRYEFTNSVLDYDV